MESFNVVKRGNFRKFLTSPRLEKLTKNFEKNGGKWKEYSLHELFIPSNGDFDIQKKHIDNIGEYVVSSGLQNSGIIGKSSINAKIFNPNTITIDMFGNVFYRDFAYKMVTHARVFSISSNILTNYKIGLYLSIKLGYLNKIFSYNNMASWSKIKNFKINLPIKNKIIDYAFIENCIRELEEEHIRELTAYLKASGLEDYNLTAQEYSAIYMLNNNKIKFEEFKLIDILNWQPQKEIDPLKINYLTICDQPKYPFYGQATANNGVISYENLDENVLNNKNGKPTILIHSNNQNCIYLETPFYLKDGHGATSVLQNEYLNELNAHFVITCIKKIITEKFSYNEKATKIALKNTIIKLPTKENNQIDYNFMNIYIRAIEKLVIRKVIDWRDKQIEKTKDVVQGYC